VSGATGLRFEREPAFSCPEERLNKNKTFL